MLRRTWHTRKTVASIACILLCAILTNTHATPTPTTSSVFGTNDTVNNFNCPEDCNCTIAATHHAHTHPHQFLHARCTSLKGLRSEAPLVSTLPIHSIDLSYLQLKRLSHSLERLHDLTSIDLSHNELHEIGHLGRRIKKLNLKHNRITSSKLTKLPQHLQVLNLQHNDITYLPVELTNLTQLQSLELSHNPINCSCETLEVRNWLQERSVFMENAVKCSYPVEAKGKPWLQIKQSEICEKEKGHAGNLGIDDTENELMLGDQPAVESSGDFNEDEEELGKDFMPVEHKSNAGSGSNEISVPSDVEGSGDLSELSLPLEATTTHAPDESDFATNAIDEDEEDGSGSGGGILILPDLARHDEQSVEDDDDFDPPVTYLSAHNADDNAYDNKPVEEPEPAVTPSPEIFGNGMGIFDPANGSVSTEGAVQEEVIVPVVHSVAEAGAPVEGDTESVGVTTEGPEKDAAIMQAKVGEDSDSNATYFLLGVIVLIVIGLVLFVGIKRCKNKRNARHDAENPRQTELLDMDKKNLGKPLHKENAPLIGEKSKSDLAKPINGAGKPYDANDVKDAGAQGQPLLKNGSGNGSAPKDAIESTLHPTEASAPTQQQQAPHEYYPITPRYPTPRSPRASKYAQHPQGENNNNVINADDGYMPSSPKTGRYSPVYSPETGRVKIKLTETPKPKTPMLVTRSKSNAGEIITTPVARDNSAAHGINGLNGNTPVGVHTGTNGHAAGHY